MSLFDPMEQVKFLHGDLRRGESDIRNFLQKIDELRTDSNFPYLDVVECDNMVRIYIELPGVNPDDFTVYQYDDAVIIEGVRDRKVKRDKVTYLRMERNCTNFRRIVRSSFFKNAVNESAVLKDGVLVLKFRLNCENIQIVEV